MRKPVGGALNPFLLLLEAFPGADPVNRHLRIAGTEIIGIKDTLKACVASRLALAEIFLLEFSGATFPIRGSLTLDEARHLHQISKWAERRAGEIVESLESAHRELEIRDLDRRALERQEAKS